MRKIPGVNTHIFKQPRIPFQEGYPYTLGSSLVGWWSVKDSNITLGGVGGTGVSLLSDKSSSGADFIQPTEAQQPNIDNPLSSSRIDFLLAGSEILYNTAQISTFSSLSQGSIVGIVGLPNSGVGAWLFSITDSSSNTDYFGISFDPGEKIRINARNTSGLFNRIESTNALSVGDVWEVRGLGNSYEILINGVKENTLTVVSGANTGQWFSSSPSLDSLSLSALNRLAPIYSDSIFKELIITSTPLTDQQSLNVANYLISKHNL